MRFEGVSDRNAAEALRGRLLRGDPVEAPPEGEVWVHEVIGAEVVAPDWNPAPKCGGGLHGLLWGEGDGSLLSWEPESKWLVVEADEADVVKIDLNKVKKQ